MLDHSFFEQPAEELAQKLLGCLLVHETAEGKMVGRIVETEAYTQDDPASHSFRGPTPRNLSMFGRGGQAYAYHSYGIHLCLNIVSGPEGLGEAVLLRALEPVEGIPLMQKRRPAVKPSNLCRGPGNLTRAMGIGISANDQRLDWSPLYLLPAPQRVQSTCSSRIGISQAKERLLRYYLAGNPSVSGPRTTVQ